MGIMIRQALIEDLPVLTAIYNSIIIEGEITADLSTYSIDERRPWFDTHVLKPFEIFVLEKNGTILGYFYFSPWRQGRAALKKVAEISFFLDKKARGMGLGNMIMAYALEQAGICGFSHLIAILLDINERSRMLLSKWGFKQAGALPGIVELRDRQAGQLIMLKKITI